MQTAREYERRIRNLLGYENPETRQMAQRLLQDASRDRHVSVRQLKHLEGLFGPAPVKEWCPSEPRGQKTALLLPLK